MGTGFAIMGIALYQYTVDQFALQAKGFQSKIAKQESQYKSAHDEEKNNLETCRKSKESIQKELNVCKTEKSEETEKCGTKIESLTENNSGLLSQVANFETKIEKLNSNSDQYETCVKQQEKLKKKLEEKNEKLDQLISLKPFDMKKNLKVKSREVVELKLEIQRLKSEKSVTLEKKEVTNNVVQKKLDKAKETSDKVDK